MIAAVGWVVLILLVWVAVAAVVGVILGRVVRNRDRQVPPDNKENKC